MKPNNRNLVGGGHYLILWHGLRCCKLPQTYISCCHSRLTLSLFPLGPCLYCLALAVTRKKRYESSTSLIALIYRLAFLLGIELRKV